MNDAQGLQLLLSMLKTDFRHTLSLFVSLEIAAFAGLCFAQDLSSDKELVEALREGGYVIYFRHAATDWSQDDHVAAEGQWTSCDPQRMRQLSSQGRMTARRIGEAIRKLNIPVGRVLSSEYCRTRETALLMALGPVQPSRSIMNMRAADFVGGPEAVIQRARRELGRKPVPGTNTVIVAHGNLMQAASGAYTAEAGAGIYLPRGEGRFDIITQIDPGKWETLAVQFGQQ